MGDDRLDIESGLEETGQAIPGFEESAACNAVDANPFKNNLIREIARDRNKTLTTKDTKGRKGKPPKSTPNWVTLGRTGST